MKPAPVSIVNESWVLDLATGDTICQVCGKRVINLLGIAMCDCSTYIPKEDSKHHVDCPQRKSLAKIHIDICQRDQEKPWSRCRKDCQWKIKKEIKSGE